MFTPTAKIGSKLIISLAVILFTNVSKANTTDLVLSTERATSQMLFERGKALLLEGNFKEACQVLEESHRLSPGIGVLLHLGVCFEQSGKLTNAWATFQEAVDRARLEHDDEREGIALARAEALRRRLAFLTLRVRPKPLGNSTGSEVVLSGVQIFRDGNEVSQLALAIAVPIDPGRHDIVVRANNMLEVKRNIVLNEGERVELDIELEPVPAMVPATPIVVPRTHKVSNAVSSSARTETARAMPNTAWDWGGRTALGIGVLGLLTASATGSLAYLYMRDARTLCADHPKNDCPNDALRFQNRAETLADVATTSAIVGTIGVFGAGTYWFYARSSKTGVNATVGPKSAFLTMRMQW